MMKILFDNGTPAPLRSYLAGHSVDRAAELGWDRLSNGALLDHAEEFGYELLITTDQSIPYQQNLARRRLAILILLSPAWPKIQLRVQEIFDVVNEMQPGELREFPV